MISWSYYGEQGVMYLFGSLGDDKIKIPVLVYKVVFCLLIVVGSSASLTNVLNLSDAMIFAMVIPNLIGLYFLLPVVKREAASYLSTSKPLTKSKWRVSSAARIGAQKRSRRRWILRSRPCSGNSVATLRREGVSTHMLKPAGRSGRWWQPRAGPFTLPTRKFPSRHDRAHR